MQYSVLLPSALCLSILPLSAGAIGSKEVYKFGDIEVQMKHSCKEGVAEICTKGILLIREKGKAERKFDINLDPEERDPIGINTKSRTLWSYSGCDSAPCIYGLQAVNIDSGDSKFYEKKTDIDHGFDPESELLFYSNARWSGGDYESAQHQLRQRLVYTLFAFDPVSGKEAVVESAEVSAFHPRVKDGELLYQISEKKKKQIKVAELKAKIHALRESETVKPTYFVELQSAPPKASPSAEGKPALAKSAWYDTDLKGEQAFDPDREILVYSNLSAVREYDPKRRYLFSLFARDTKAVKDVRLAQADVAELRPEIVGGVLKVTVGTEIKYMSMDDVRKKLDKDGAPPMKPFRYDLDSK